MCPASRRPWAGGGGAGTFSTHLRRYMMNTPFFPTERIQLARRSMKRWFLSAALCGSISVCGAMEAQEFVYPETRTVDVVEDYHGIQVPDRFQWLENDVREDKEVAEWVEAQNEVTFGYLKSLPSRDQIESRLTELWDYEKFSAPFKVADVYYFSKNDGLQNQNVLYRMDTLDSEPVMVLDPNTWSEDGTIALGGLAFSEDGRYMAYGIQDGGTDWRTWRIMDTESGELLDDELKWLKFGGLSWTHDHAGFYYSRFPEPAEGETFQSTNLNNKI
jgi:prolyl oligopeptidase